MPSYKTDICVIGAGSGGLSVAAAAVQMGARVTLIESGKMGGDCLNYGCVPSKSLLAAAKRADALGHLEQFGISNVTPSVSYAGVHQHVKSVIAAIAPNDSVERFEKLGVKVLRGVATFQSKKTIQVNDERVTAKYFVIATGSSPVAPPIPGLDRIDYLTNETIFDLIEQPKKLIVIGGGPIGCELSQAHRRLGTPVVILEAFNILPKDDQELTDIVRHQLIADGIELHEQIRVVTVEKAQQGVRVVIEKNGSAQVIEGSHLLIAAGRRPNLQALDLAAAGVAFEKTGVKVDARLRTSNKRVYAIGDAAGGFQFTHAANYHAGIVIRNMLFHLPAKVNYSALPWVTYTSPTLAHVGINQQQAEEKNIKHRILSFDYAENDRAQAEHQTQGKIKVVVSNKGVVLGASIVGANADELITPWVLAINNKLKISAMASIIVPYPTLSEISKRAAGSYYVESLFSPRMKKIVRFLLKF